MNIKPLGDRIVVRREVAEDRTVGGIVLPDSAKNKPQRGTILAVGPGKLLKDGTRRSLQVQKGDKVTCVVLNVDQERKRIALGLKQMNNDPWEGDIPGRYKPGEIKKGKVTKLTNFGVFVELEPGLEALLHISELADTKVESPEDVVKVGDEIEVKILRVDAADRKIGLSRKRLGVAEEPDDESETSAEPARAAKSRELRGGTGSGGGQLINLPESGDKK